MGDSIVVSKYFSDELIAMMIKVWPSISQNTFNKLTRMNSVVDGNSTLLIQCLEFIHPIVFQRVRSRASTDITQGL